VHVRDIQPSPEPEFVDCPRCGQPVLMDNLSRQWNEISGLQRLPAATQRILDTVQQIARDLTDIPARVFTSRLETLIDELVSSLVPLMEAEERALCPNLDSHLAEALREDHREVRRCIERLSMLAESLVRRIGSTPATGPMRTALRQMISALAGLSTHQNDALRNLGATVPLDEQARLAATLEAAAIDARERTMLIIRPEIPPTASTVLRHRPDLTAAYAMSLAEIERQSRRRSLPAEEG
jgi:hypothetical protein